MVDRLGALLPKIISTEQNGFIHGRQIKDCITITSEATDLLSRKDFGAYVALKIYISKAFDTIHWLFLIKVLKKFGCDAKFCKWIIVIIESNYFSVGINGKQVGFLIARMD